MEKTIKTMEHLKEAMQDIYSSWDFETQFCLNTGVMVFNIDLKEKK